MADNARPMPSDLDVYKDRIERIVEERRELFDRLA